MRRQNLKIYKLPSNWSRGKCLIIEIVWQVFFKQIVSSSLPGTIWRKIILCLFGANIGKKVRLSPGLKVKMPWRLSIDDYSWIGEDTWIDNLAKVEIGKNVCVSQGVYFCTGNHDFNKESFNLIWKPIIIGEESWIGAKCLIGPGKKIGKGSVVKMGSVITQDIPDQSIFSTKNLRRNYFVK